MIQTIQTILIVWFFLTLPIVYQVNKIWKDTEDDWKRNDFAYQMVLIWKSFWKAPRYYFLTITLLFTNKK